MLSSNARLVFFMMLFLMISGCGSSGGGDPVDDSSTSEASDNNDATDDSNSTGSENITDDQNNPAPMYAGFNFKLSSGDYWEYQWDMYEYTWAQGSDPSTSRVAGRFRITLGSKKVIAGITTYKVNFSGLSKGDDNDFYQGEYKYLAIKESVLLGSKDGVSMVTIFDANKGYWTGGGFFNMLPDSLIEATSGSINNDYIKSSAIMVGRSSNQNRCEIIAGLRICGDDSSSVNEKEYYGKNTGPLGYYYENIYEFCGGGFCSGGTRKNNVGLVASSFRGDVTDHVLEIEPNNSYISAQSLDTVSKVIGYIKRQDPGTKETQVGVNANNLDQIVADWYKLTIPEGNGLQVYKNIKLEFPGTYADLDLYVFDSDMIKYAWSVDNNRDTAAYIEETTVGLYPGTYYIGVHAWSTVKNSEYTLSF